MVKIDLFHDFIVVDAYESCVFRGSLMIDNKHGGLQQIDRLVYKSHVPQPELYKVIKRDRSKQTRNQGYAMWQRDDDQVDRENSSMSLVREIDAYVNLSSDEHGAMTPKLIGVDICAETHRVRGIVMEDAGSDLKSLVKIPGAQPSPDECLRICTDMMIKLNQLHQSGFVHRDIKLNNCVRPTDIQWIDFGLCKRSAGLHDVTDECANFGTPGHLPPELMLYHTHVDWHKCDVWSMCAALAAMMAGRTRLFSNEDYRFMIDYGLMFGTKTYELINIDWLKPHSKLRLWFNRAMVKHDAMLDAAALILDLDAHQKSQLQSLYQKADTAAALRKVDNDVTRCIHEMACATDTVTAYHRTRMLNPNMPDDNFAKCQLHIDEHKVACITDPVVQHPSRFWELMVWTHTFEQHEPESSCSQDARALRAKLKKRYVMIDLEQLEYGDLDLMHHGEARQWMDAWWSKHFETTSNAPMTIADTCQQLTRFSKAMRAGMAFDPSQRPSIADLIQILDPQFATRSTSASLLRTGGSSLPKYRYIHTCTDIMMEVMQYVILKFWCAVEANQHLEDPDCMPALRVDTYQPFVHHAITMYTHWASSKSRWSNPIPCYEQWELMLDGQFNTVVDAHLVNHHMMLLACLFLSATMYLDNHRDTNRFIIMLYCEHILNESEMMRINHPSCPSHELFMAELIASVADDLCLDDEEEEEADDNDLSISTMDMLSSGGPTTTNTPPSGEAKDTHTDDQACRVTDADQDEDEDQDEDDQSMTRLLEQPYGHVDPSHSTRKAVASWQDLDEGEDDDDDDEVMEPTMTMMDVIHHMVYTLIHDTQLKIQPPAMHALKHEIDDGAFARFINYNTSKLHYLTKDVDIALILMAHRLAYRRAHPTENLNDVKKHPWSTKYDMDTVERLAQSLNLGEYTSDGMQVYP